MEQSTNNIALLLSRVPQSGVLRGESGAPLLEMVLFVPVAFLFLFMAVDAGYAYIEQAALADALRSGLNSEKSCLAASTLEPIADPSEISPNIPRAQLEQVVKCMAANIAGSIASSSGLPLSDYKVDVTPVVLRIDPTNGTLLSYSAQPISLDASVAGTFNISRMVPEYPVKQRDDYISEQLASQIGVAPTRYSIPLGVSALSISAANSSVRYLNSTVLIYGEVTSLTRGIARSYAKGLLGRFFALQLQELRSLRLQVS